ncbi:MAG TPA: S1/P1 nuclease [Nitrospira sp.]|nr:S1/P1 nuclease [Nitrospira sp.]
MKAPVLTIIAILCLTTNAVAWNELGHMIVAASAYDQLTPEVRQRVAILLKLNPKYATWVAGVPAKEKDRIAFLKASIWADEIKQDPAYMQDGTHDGNRPSGPTAGQNIGYADQLQHKYWHFIYLPFSPDDTKPVEPAIPNAKTQIILFGDTLKSPTASNDVKSYDLVWLLHLVGDVHHPLHAVSRFTKAQPAGDEGGNLVSVCWNPCTKHEKLHKFWDEILGISTNPNTAISQVSQLPPVDPQMARIRDEATWVAESFQAAQSKVYVSPIGEGTGPYVLTDSYRTAAWKLAAHRTGLAAARLAILLNDALQ